MKGLNTEYSITCCKTATIKDPLSSLLTSDTYPSIFSRKTSDFATKKRGKERQVVI